MLPQVVLDGPISPKVLCEIQTHRSCSIAQVRSLTDFLLMQLSWIYDLNYSASFHQIIDRNIIGEIKQQLPKEPSISQTVQAARQFAKQSQLS